MSEKPLTLPLENTVVVVGVGLIGGSLAAALKHRNVARTVIGIGRDQHRLERARDAGLLDEVPTDIASIMHRANLVVFCTPVERLAVDVRAAISAPHVTSERGRAQGDTSTTANASHGTGIHQLPLLTDVGSVKGPLCSELADVPQFIGSHPIAGSHRQGFEAADPHLFQGRVCVLTPNSDAPRIQVERLERFWRAVGMTTIEMSPAAHDQSLAMTSHLPHVVAAALAGTLAEDMRSLTGSGFRDTTRVAGGSPDLWTGILLNNADYVADGIHAVQQQLEQFRLALQARDSAAIQQLLAVGHKSRIALDET